MNCETHRSVIISASLNNDILGKFYDFSYTYTLHLINCLVAMRKKHPAEISSVTVAAHALAVQARINHILSSSPAVLYSFRATGSNNPTFVSENLQKVFGYEPRDYLEDRNFVPERIHPEDT